MPYCTHSFRLLVNCLSLSAEPDPVIVAIIIIILIMNASTQLASSLASMWKKCFRLPYKCYNFMLLLCTALCLKGKTSHLPFPCHITEDDKPPQTHIRLKRWHTQTPTQKQQPNSSLLIFYNFVMFKQHFSSVCLAIVRRPRVK